MIGLSTYSFFWRWSHGNGSPMSLLEMLERTHALGVRLFQICDYPAIEQFSDSELESVRSQAHDLKISLELGTRGVRPEHLDHYRRLADALDVSLIRSMLHTADHKPSVTTAVEMISSVLPSYEQRGITLALETYELVSTDDLLAVVAGVGSDHLGICLDPANCVARLELPSTVVARTAPHVVNLHVKDFRFTRREGRVGFTLAGCPLGTGLLDYDGMIKAVRPGQRGINQIVEHWVPLQTTIADACRTEDEWTRHNVAFLRDREQAAP